MENASSLIDETKERHGIRSVRNPNSDSGNPSDHLHVSKDLKKERFNLASFVEPFEKGGTDDEQETPAPVGSPLVPEKISTPAIQLWFDQNLRRDLITYLESEYWENDGKYPTIKDIRDKFGSYTEASSLTNNSDWEDFIDSLSDALDGRGLPIFRTNHQVIDPFFVLAVNLLCDTTDKRSKAAKLKEAGISTRKFTAMMARKKNADYYRSRMDRIFANDIEPNAQAAISRGVEAGDIQAIKFYYEVTDKYRPQQSIGADLSTILTAMMEILARHVEGRVLATIASELSQSPAIAKMIGVIDVQNHS